MEFRRGEVEMIRFADDRDVMDAGERFIVKHMNTLLALIHGDQGEQRLECNCAYCWRENPAHRDE